MHSADDFAMCLGDFLMDTLVGISMHLMGCMEGMV